jgi:hypothetical protein
MWMLEGARGPHGNADLPVVNAEAADKVRYIPGSNKRPV